MKKLKVTHLHEWHVKHAKMVEFAGYHMPIWYNNTGIIEEHLAVRNNAGIFDVTHMGRLKVTGKDAEEFLNYMCTNDVSKLEIGKGHYSTMLNEKGGIIDDLIIYKLGEEEYYVVVNSANKEIDLQWLNAHIGERNVKIEDISDSTPQFAVQGPKAIETLQKICGEDIISKPYNFGDVYETKLAGFDTIITRTGYTGEDGVEISQLNVPLNKPENAIKLWEAILTAGEEFHIKPCGLGARDSLRLEAGMPLHGSDITPETTPLEARLKFAVKLNKGEFIGRDALLEQIDQGVKRFRVGLIMIDKGIPRSHLQINKGTRKIGETTSGGYTPLLPRGYGIAQGYVEREYRESGLLVHIVIHSKLRLAEVVSPRRMLARVKARSEQLKQTVK
ncbi:MAG: glycine cleavage system aminomethyltransferase GcvT [Candidatus Odinarchaeia archaeon]